MLSLLGVLPAVVPFLPGISLRSIIVLLPVANIAVAANCGQINNSNPGSQATGFRDFVFWCHLKSAFR